MKSSNKNTLCCLLLNYEPINVPPDNGLIQEFLNICKYICPFFPNNISYLLHVVQPLRRSHMLAYCSWHQHWSLNRILIHLTFTVPLGIFQIILSGLEGFHCILILISFLCDYREL